MYIGSIFRRRSPGEGGNSIQRSGHIWTNLLFSGSPGSLSNMQHNATCGLEQREETPECIAATHAFAQAGPATAAASPAIGSA